MASDDHCGDLLDLLAGDEPLAALERWREQALTHGGVDDRVTRWFAAALAVRTRLDDRRRRESELLALSKTALELAADQDLEHLLLAIVERTRELLGSEMAYLTLLDAERGDVYVRVVCGAQTESFARIRLAVGSGLGGLVAATGVPYWTGDMRADARIVHGPDVRAATAAEGIVAVCGVPLLVEGRVIGVLYAADRQPRPFSHAEIALMASLAAHAAVALDNARRMSATRTIVGAAEQDRRRLQEDADELRRLDAIRSRLMDIAVRGGDANDVAAVTAAALGGTVTIFDETGAPTARPTGADAGSEPVRAAALAALREARPVDDNALAVRAVPLAALGDVLGALVHEGADAPRALREATLDTAAVVLGVLLSAQRARADAEHHLRGELLVELVRGRVGGDARRRARLAGLDLQPPLAAAVALVPAPSRRRGLLAARATAAEAGGTAALVDEALVVVACGDADRLAAALHQRLHDDRMPTLVVGTSVNGDVRAVASAFREGVQCAAALRALGRVDGVAGPDEIGAFAALLTGSDPATVADYVDRTLGPLLRYDERRGTALAPTLAAVFESGQSLQAAADRLHVHINTLYQRLDRVSELVGGPWRDPWRALNLQIALVLHHAANAGVPDDPP